MASPLRGTAVRRRPPLIEYHYLLNKALLTHSLTEGAAPCAARLTDSGGVFSKIFALVYAKLCQYFGND